MKGKVNLPQAKSQNMNLCIHNTICINNELVEVSPSSLPNFSLFNYRYPSLTNNFSSLLLHTINGLFIQKYFHQYLLQSNRISNWLTKQGDKSYLFLVFVVTFDLDAG
ncbi:hypothetical protein QFZ73_005781 [Peribacillus sp. V2I11]|nr:hypothetical protein [Peribacillus sp. V2I11]